MCRINFQSLHFEHLVIFKQEHTIFACGREMVRLRSPQDGSTTALTTGSSTSLTTGSSTPLTTGSSTPLTTSGNGRINGSTSLTTGGKTRLFLVFGNGDGRVYARNGRAESWELLKEQDANKIRRSLELARENNIPTYLLNGSCKQLVG